MSFALQSKRMTTTLVGKMQASDRYFDFAISTRGSGNHLSVKSSASSPASSSALGASKNTLTAPFSFLRCSYPILLVDLDLDDSALEVAIVHNRRIRSEM